MSDRFAEARAAAARMREARAARAGGEARRPDLGRERAEREGVEGRRLAAARGRARGRA